MPIVVSENMIPATVCYVTLFPGVGDNWTCTISHHNEIPFLPKAAYERDSKKGKTDGVMVTSMIRGTLDR
jgi:hypothetical protein